jgi:6-pyruvoyltetrahydropterin/6-carboxytetrahydropterin synthase
MLVTRNYHFYAAHRAHTLIGDKCISLHGHTYDVEVILDFPRTDPTSGVSMLFKDIDAKVQPLVDALDHSTLLCEADPLTACLAGFNEQQADGAVMKLSVFPFPTTAENIARWFFYTLAKVMGNRLVEVKVSETKSGYVSFSLRDAQNEARERAAAEAEALAQKADEETKPTEKALTEKAVTEKEVPMKVSKKKKAKK